MIKRPRSLRRDTNGASLAEFALILPLLILLVFGIMDVGFLMWQYQQGQIAAKRAVRLAATRTLISPGTLGDCGPSTGTNVPGTRCAAIPDTSVWATCTGDGGGGAACGPDVTRVAAEIAGFYGRVDPADIEIELRGGNMGFVGMGRPVPLITVRFNNVSYNTMFIGPVLNAAAVNMPSMSASAVAEDIQNGT